MYNTRAVCVTSISIRSEDNKDVTSFFSSVRRRRRRRISTSI
jgi:hypothetical protein